MEIKKKKPDIRFLYDIKEVMYDKKWFGGAKNFPLYYMYRGLKRNGDLRYDITILPPKMLGKEFVKTKGNRNAKGYQELYTVLKGKALFFMQKTKGKSVGDAFAIEAKPGNWVIVPPNYIIITINPSKQILKTGNWVSEKTQNIYDEVEQMRGGCYYYIKSGWVKNKNYKKVPKLRFEKPLKQMPKNLNFLNPNASR